MGRVVRFSEFDKYLIELKDKNVKVEGTILDANIIITLSYSPKKYHTRTYDFIKDKIQRNNISLYTTVNTTQEYLEFHRRLLLTEGLRTVIHPSSKNVLPNKKKQVIRAQSSILQARETHHKADPVFKDGEIKAIREVFFNSGNAGVNLWKGLCKQYLKNPLEIEFKALTKLNIDYLSMYKDDQKEIFHKKITWEDAISICSDIGAGFSDSMILNALQATSLPFAISLDSDLGHAVMANPQLKDILMPDEIVDRL
jgi:hypothetical protein